MWLLIFVAPPTAIWLVTRLPDEMDEEMRSW